MQVKALCVLLFFFSWMNEEIFIIVFFCKQANLVLIIYEKINNDQWVQESVVQRLPMVYQIT